jgi:hypothetical protein
MVVAGSLEKNKPRWEGNKLENKLIYMVYWQLVKKL